MLTLAPEGNRGRGATLPGYDPNMIFGDNEDDGAPQRLADIGRDLVNSGRFDWALEEIPEAGIPRIEDRHASAMAMLLLNQLRQGAPAAQSRALGIRAVMEDVQTGDLALPTKWSLPIIRRIYPTIFDAPFFATQPMPGPLAYAFFLDFKREADGTDLRAIAPFTAFIASTAASAQANVSLKVSTKPNAVGYTANQFVAGQSVTVGVGQGTVETKTILSVNNTTGVVTLSTNLANTHNAGEIVYITAPASLGEAAVPQKGKLSLTRQSVSANKWMFGATWSTEAMEDARAQLNLDVEAELVQALSVEIGRELFGTILSDIVQGATGGSTTIAARGATAVNDYRYLAIQPIWDAEALIYSKRYHDADTLLCGIDIAALISQQDNFHVGPADKSMMSQLGVTHLGTFQGKFEVYKTPFLPPNLALVFNKPTNWLHAGYVYMPYVPLAPMPLVYAGYNAGTGAYANTDEWTRNIRTRAGRLLTVSDEYGLMTAA